MNKQRFPRIRFDGFLGDWEKKTLADVSIVERGKFSARPRNDPKFFGGSMPFIQTGDITNSDLFLTNYTQTLNSDGILVSKVFPQKTILITIAANIGDTAITTFDIACPDSVVAIRADENRSNVFFLKYILDLKRAFLNDCATQNAQKNINLQVLNPLEIKLCSLAEQTHLGLFFRRLDSQITESRAVLEKSRQLKKAMLAKMFPANGEKIPKIRFKGFEGEWERNELGCLGYCLSGIGFSENEQGGENGIPFFKVSDMNLSGNEVYLRKANNYVTQEQIDKQRWQVIQQLPCIFFAKVGAALLLNRKRLVNTPFLLDNNTMAFILDSSLDNYFMKTLFDTIDLPALAQIGALPSINAKDIEKNIVFIPTPKEQSAIGNFFRQLDETIALQSAEVEKLNQLKKGLLAAMLV